MQNRLEWLPIWKSIIDTDMLGGLDGTRPTSKDIKKILDSVGGRIYRWLQSIPVLRILKDSHSKLTSDDLLWYLRGIGINDTEDKIAIKEIKIKDDSIVIPRVLSTKIKLAIDWLKLQSPL